MNDDCDHTFDDGKCQHCDATQTIEERRAADAAAGECSFCGRDLSDYPDGCPSDDCPSLDDEEPEPCITDEERSNGPRRY